VEFFLRDTEEKTLEEIKASQMQLQNFLVKFQGCELVTPFFFFKEILFVAKVAIIHRKR
jgi:hypothetical protein